jgi:biotin transport system substrate-specific component
MILEKACRTIKIQIPYFLFISLSSLFTGKIMNIKVGATTALPPQSFKSSCIKTVLFSLIGALLTGYAAQLRIPLPWTPVPTTLQTFVVLAAGLFLGARWGSISQIIYLALSIAGCPLFSSMESGWSVIAGPRGGYLIGFTIASFVIGSLFSKRNNRSSIKTFFILFLVNIGIIHGLGCLHLFFYFWNTTGNLPNIFLIFGMGMLSFIPGEILKVSLLSAITKKIRY